MTTQQMRGRIEWLEHMVLTVCLLVIPGILLMTPCFMCQQLLSGARSIHASQPEAR